MEEAIDSITPTEKIFKEKAIWVGSFLGGPLTAGYLIAENFKAFNETNKAKKTWIYAIITTIVVFGGAFLIPDNVKFPNQIIPLTYTAVAYFLVKHFQEKNISTHIDAGGKLHSWWRTIAVSIIGLAITVIPIFSLALFIESATSVGADMKTYGFLKHEILFDKSNISEKEVDKIADGLTESTFFDDALQKSVYVKKVNNDFEISISCFESITTDEETLQAFIQFRNELQVFFPDNKIVINLVVDNLDNVVKRIE
jgi:hypothetical protein